MKELTIEQKAQRYDKALTKAKTIVNSINVGLIGKDSFEAVFPELKENRKESTDEKVRKALIKLVTNHASMDLFIEYDIHLDEALSWLEKQAFNVDNANKEYWRGYREGKLEILDKYADLEKRSKQKLVEKYNITGIGSKNAQGKLGEMIKNLKPADKVEPKFKVGDWITDGNITIQIKAIENDCYLYCGDCVLYSTKTADKVYHLWTIEDAKDGDVLFDGHSACIFRKTMEDDDTVWIDSYCGITSEDEFVVNDENECWCTAMECVPATKEQRDLLFQKMRDTGYEWNAEKKELKKIEQKHTESRQEIKPNGGIVYEDFNEGDGSYKVNLAYLSKPQVEFIEDLVDSWKNTTNNTTEWSEEDEEMIKGLTNCLDELEKNGWCYFYVNDKSVELNKMRKWLKSLRLHNTWKPGNEQLRELKNVFSPDTDSWDEDILRGLYEQLKQL